MPFSSWFGGTDTAAAASTSPQHIRKVSLGSSSDARSKSKSYTKSSTSGLSRHRTSRHANANSYNTTTQRKPIVAIEPSMDDSRSMRIDQGLIDASNEAIQNQKASTSSWWSSFYGQNPVTVDQPKPPHTRALSAPDISSNTDKSVSSHRRVVSKTTYRA